MTTDPFTEAARAEAGRRFPLPDRKKRHDGTPEGVGQEGFEQGAEWARTHLAAQKPSDAECIAVLNAVTTPLGEKPKYTVWFPAAIQRCREAMMSARAARRDEEKRAACGCDLTGPVPPAVHIVDRHEERR